MAALLPIPTPAVGQEPGQDEVVWTAGALQRILAKRDYPTVVGLAAMNRALERGDVESAEGIRHLLGSLGDASGGSAVAGADRCRGLGNPVEGTLCAVESLVPVLPAAVAGDVAEEGARLVSTYFRSGETTAAIPAFGGEGIWMNPLQGFTEGVLEDVWRLRDQMVPGDNDAPDPTSVSTLVGGVLGFSPGEPAAAILPKVPGLRDLVLRHPTLSGLNTGALGEGAMLQEYRSFLGSIGGPTQGIGGEAGQLGRGLMDLTGSGQPAEERAPLGAAGAVIAALADRTGPDGLIEGLEVWAAHRSFVYVSARSAALSGLDGGVTERMRTLGNAAADLRREGLAFTANLSTLGQQAAAAVLSGNMFTVAARVASFFHLTPGALGGGASEDIRALREGVDGMRAEMAAEFEQVDGRFDEVVGMLDTRFNRLESLVASNHREVREDLLSLQLGLSVLGRRMDRMESNLQTYMQAGFDRDFSRTLIRCLEHRERHLPPYDRIEFAAFSECLTDLRARAVQDARDALLTDRTTPVDDVSLAEALADLSEDNLAYRLPLLARAAEQRFAYDGLLGGRGGVNAIEWSVAAQAYLTMLGSWPDHTLAVGPGDLEAILAAGLELQEILRAVTASPRDATRGGLLTQVMRAYEDHVGVLTAEADVLARRHQQAQLLRVDPASVLGRMTPATEGRPELDTPGNVADAVPQEVRTAAVLALREPQLVYRTASAEHMRRDRFRRSGIFRQRRHDRHTFTQTTVVVELRLGDDQVAATYTATGPSVLTRVEEMSGGETSEDVRGVRDVIPDVDAHFASELWPALADDPAAWGIGRPGDALLNGIERAIETELRRHETAALGEVFTAVCQDGPVTAVAADPDRASAARIRESLDGMTATRRLLGAYLRLGLPGTVDQDFQLRQLLYGPDGLLDREALCRIVSAGESPLRVVWLEEEPRRRAKELSEVLGAALERGSTLPGTAPTVDPMIEQLRAALRIQQVRTLIARGQN